MQEELVSQFREYLVQGGAPGPHGVVPNVFRPSISIELHHILRHTHIITRCT